VFDAKSFALLCWELGSVWALALPVEPEQLPSSAMQEPLGKKIINISKTKQTHWI